MTNENWIYVCNTNEIELEDLKRFDYENNSVCIYRLENGFFATTGCRRWQLTRPLFPNWQHCPPPETITGAIHLNEMPVLHRLRQNERRRFMVNFPSGYLESKLYARALQRWADTARKAATVDLATLRRQRSRARLLRGRHRARRSCCSGLRAARPQRGHRLVARLAVRHAGGGVPPEFARGLRRQLVRRRGEHERGDISAIVPE